ncbi:MAG: hypothetical protein KKE20_02545 [Nanoarchaeota archaeon]|nr:hypothetical protein [Nanoarchaeota archaeon]
MEDLEQRLKQLKKDKPREKLVDQIFSYRDITSSRLNYLAAAALDQMVSSIIKNPSKELVNNVVLTSARYTNNISPYQRVCKGGGIDCVHSWKMFSKEYLLSCSRKNGHLPAPVCATAELSLNLERTANGAERYTNIRISWKNENRLPVSKNFGLKGFLYCSDLSPERFKESTGMAVKRTTNLGRFWIGGTRYAINPAIESLPMVVLFSNGRLFPYDLYGKRIEYREINSNKE